MQDSVNATVNGSKAGEEKVKRKLTLRSGHDFTPLAIPSMHMFTISAIIIIKYSQIPPNLAPSIIVLLGRKKKF